MITFDNMYKDAMPGDYFEDRSILIGSEYKPCTMCKKPTRCIDIASEGHFCSKECMDKFYNNMQEHEKKIREKKYTLTFTIKELTYDECEELPLRLLDILTNNMGKRIITKISEEKDYKTKRKGKVVNG